MKNKSSSRYKTISTILLPLILTLSACGGGGSDDTPPETAEEPNYSKTELINDLAQVISNKFTNTQSQFATLNSSTIEFCTDINNNNNNNNNNDNFITLQNHWKAAENSWQQVQGLGLGPMLTNDARLKIDYYLLKPDPTELAEDINEILASSDDINLIAIQVQGLPALEYLLFRDNALANIQSNANRHCQLLTAISSNIDSLMTGIESQWQTNGSYYQTFTNADLVAESLENLLRPLVEHLQIVQANKLNNAAVDDAFVESGLAQHSIENIRNNLSLIQDLTHISNDSGLSYFLEDNDFNSVQDRFNTRLASAINLANQSSDSLVSLKQSAEGQVEIANLENAIAQMLEVLANEVAESLDVFLGFNFNDGD